MIVEKLYGQNLLWTDGQTTWHLYTSLLGSMKILARQKSNSKSPELVKAFYFIQIFCLAAVKAFAVIVRHFSPEPTKFLSCHIAILDRNIYPLLG